MTIQQLRTAMEAARTGSITQAAKNLYLSQPNASSMLRTLEQELGYEIFSRTNSGIVPTEAGERFLEHAKVILAQLQELYTIRAQGRVCRLRLGVQSFSPAVEAFIRLTPEQNPVAITQDAFFQGGKGWFFNVSMQNESDVAFVPESVTVAYFYQGKQQRQVAQPTSAFGFSEMRKGGEPMIYEDAAAYQAFDSVGVMLKGTDANGNALSFTTLVHFSQETNP